MGYTTSITLVFMSGTHLLSDAIKIKFIGRLFMYPLTKRAEVSIACSHSAGFLLYHIGSISINQISFLSCNFKGSYGIVMDSVNQAELNNLTISNSAKAGLFVYRSTLILDSTVIRNCGHYNRYLNTFGGALRSYRSHVVVTGMSEFSGNMATNGGAIALTDGSLVIKGRAVTFSDNLALFGGALYIQLSTTVELRGNFTKNTAKYGGGAVCILNTAIVTMNGVFLQNSALYGGAVKIFHSKVVIIPGERSTLFSNNTATISGGSMILKQCTLHIQDNGCSMELNTAGLGGGALYSYNSLVSFSANMTFAKNTASEGGAYFLNGKSHFILGEESSVFFKHNNARGKGGALFVESNAECYNLQVQYCFFEVRKVGIFLQFENNFAAIAGNVLYGNNIETCLNHNYNDLKYDFISISNITENTGTSNRSNIASNPFKVCSCHDTTIMCSHSSHDVLYASIFPGQTVNIPVVAVGQENGVVPTTVQASLGPDSRATFGAFQNSQKTQEKCSNLSFQVYSSDSSEIITLTVGGCSTLVYVQHLQLNVTLLECPVGFQLSGDPAECLCQDRLLVYTQTCSIGDQKIHRTSDFWVGYNNEGLILHPHCPFHYCIPPPNNFTIEQSDKQCNYNRTGLLCGQCQDGLSLTLGTSRCLQCSNYYLALLAAFAIAGLTLVIILFGCRLTVAKGTVNALIFYANIVHDNRTLFFPTGSTNILTVFIAWLNLDLGIESCFYKGMDTYAQTWLQFVFPIYLWLLCGCIVFTSRKFKCMSRVMGTNPVAVLATLFLLSYTKLLRTAMAALSFTTLSYPHEHYEVVWLYDANIRYLHGKHIPLFVVGLATLLLCLPYTLLLLTNQWLQARSNLRLLWWVNSPRIKFFLDAYTAPFNLKYRYWTGLLLVFRISLMTVSATNALGDPNINLVAACTTAACIGLWLWLFGSPYQKKMLNVIEVSLLFNLMLLSVFTLYIHSSHGSQAALVYTSIIVSLIVFILVLFVHGCIHIKRTAMWKTYVTKRGSCLVDTERSDDEASDQRTIEQRVTCSEVVIHENMHNGPREPPVDTCLHASLRAEYTGSDSSPNNTPDCFPVSEDSYHPECNWTGSNIELREPLLPDEPSV